MSWSPELGQLLHRQPLSRYSLGMITLGNADAAALGAICTRYGIGRLEVFGSVARGVSAPESDLDLLYELVPGHQLGWEISELNDELDEFFARKVDLVAKKYVNKYLRDEILRESRPLYAAC